MTTWTFHRMDVISILIHTRIVRRLIEGIVIGEENVYHISVLIGRADFTYGLAIVGNLLFYMVLLVQYPFYKQYI